MDCVNSIGSYTCVCNSGFSGETCQSNETDGDATPTSDSRTSKMESEVSSLWRFQTNMWAQL